MDLGYRIVERFAPTSSSAWAEYVEWSKLDHLIEVVSLDCCLCPAVRIESASDHRHERYSEHLTEVFDDWRYPRAMLPKERDILSLQIIAVLREPTDAQMRELGPLGFDLMGFDLIEDDTCISALNNCGGFDEVFRARDLNQCGLLSDLSFAQDTRKRLRETYPEEPHADCAIWAIWRQKSGEL